MDKELGVGDNEGLDTCTDTGLEVGDISEGLNTWVGVGGNERLDDRANEGLGVGDSEGLFEGREEVLLNELKA